MNRSSIRIGLQQLFLQTIGSHYRAICHRLWLDHRAIINQDRVRGSHYLRSFFLLHEHAEQHLLELGKRNLDENGPDEAEEKADDRYGEEEGNNGLGSVVEVYLFAKANPLDYHEMYEIDPE